MSAETLRRAAALMRAQAEGARAGRWSITDSGLVPEAYLVVANWEGGPRRIATCAGSLPEGNRANAKHIASWHPAVALAVADWLDSIVTWIDGGGLGSVEDRLVETSALNLARAYLGESA